MAYLCSCCGEMHDDWPALAYEAPDNYYCLSPDEKQTIAELDSDTCIIRWENGTGYFIRVSMHQKVIGTDETLDYGLWVSLSQTSFNDYIGHYDDRDYQEGYFGWLCNDLPDYEFPDSIPVDVYTSRNGKRPIIVPHHSHHPFVVDYENGITMETAHERIDSMLNRI